MAAAGPPVEVEGSPGANIELIRDISLLVTLGAPVDINIGIEVDVEVDTDIIRLLLLLPNYKDIIIFFNPPTIFRNMVMFDIRKRVYSSPGHFIDIPIELFESHI